MKTIYKLYDLKFVSCTKKEFDNLLTSEIRDDCAYIINDEGKITIHLNSAEEKLRTWLPLHRDLGKESFAQSQDDSYTGIKIKTKNPDAYKLDNTLTDNEIIGSLGNYSSSFGGNTQAKGKRSFAVGTGTLARGNYTFASGSDSVALGSASHVEGYKNTTGPNADSAHAEGGENVVTSNRGHAEGYHNTVSGVNAHAEGGNNTASAEEAHAEGLGNIASGKYSHAEGQSTVASGEQAHSEGSKTKAVGDRAHAEGDSNESNALNSHSEGSGNKILTSVGDSDTPGTGSGGSTPSGDDWSIDDHLGVNSHVEGSQNLVYGYSAHVEGANNKVKGHYAHSEGAQNTVDAEAAHAEGLTNTIDVKSKAAHVEGYNNSIKEAIYTHIEGMSNSTVPNKGSIRYGHIEGYNNKIISSFANNYIDSGHVEGTDNIVSAGNGHAEGSNTQATGINSHAQNSNTVASGPNSTAIGSKTTAVGESSFAGGLETVAKDIASLAFGTKNTAVGWNATAFGSYNKSYIDQFIIGKYAKNVDDPWNSDTYPYFAIGNGDNDTTRKNAFTVYREGFAELQNQGTTDNSVVIRKYLNDTIASQVSSVYKAKGSIANISALAVPSKAYDGFVYNIETEFTTTDNFVEGAGKKFPAGTNVVCINTTGTTYKWDVLAGMVDLSTYATTNALTGGLAKKQDKFADLDYVWDGDSFEYLTLSVKNAIKKTSTSVHTSIVSKLRLSTEMGNEQVHLTAGSFTVDPDDNGRYSSGLYNNFLMFKDRKVSDRLYSMLITPTAHTGNTPAYLTLSSPAQNTAVGHANIRLTGIDAPTTDSDATNKAYVDTNFQAKLVSGTNIKSIKDDKTEAQSLLGSGNLSFKTINNQSLLGSGNITIEGGSGGSTITVDDTLSDTSTNPVQNKVINAALDKKQDKLYLKAIDDGAYELSISPVGSTKHIVLDTHAGVVSTAFITDLSSLAFYSSDTKKPRMGYNSDLKALKLYDFNDSNEPPICLTGIADGTNNNDAVNVSQLNKKQDKLTSTTDLAIRSVTASNVSTKLLQSGTDALQIVGSEIKLSSNNKKAIKITNLADGTTTNDAINKGQLDTAVANKQDTFSTVTTTTDETTLTADKPINITTNKYSMVYDDTNEAIKITFA